MQHTRRRLKRLYIKAQELIQLDRLDESWPYITEMMNLDMDNPGGLYLCGVFMRKRGHIGVATQMFRRAVAIEPKPLNPWMHFGAALHDLHQFDAAMQVWDMLAKKSPGDTGVLRNMACTHLQRGNFHEALNKINQAIELLPEGTEIPKGYQAIRGQACLGLGRWEEGFDGYRGLYGEQLVIRKYRQPEEPEWDGTPGQTVIVQGDQGLGDELRFSSVLPNMAKDCKVIYDCHPRLVNLFKRSFPEIEIYGTRKKTVVNWLDDLKFDASCHVSSLGRFYRKRDEDFPRKPYLTASPTLRDKWRRKLADLPRPLIGLAWQGGHVQTMREHRSFDLATFVPVIQEGGSFIDLSYHDSEDEVAYFNSLSENKVLRFDVDQDYDDTLALVAELDLVICVPTTVLHAAGAVGTDCWVYHPRYPFWEFGRDREDMIWYAPGQVRLFRGNIEDLRDAYLERIGGKLGESLHRYGQQAAASIHRAAELDHPTSFKARSDHAADPAAASGPSKGPD